ncbi:MAG: alpha-amylase [Chloroflexi bacterium]|nr:alpha-amylase [Chloroflexota bacterium]
MPNRVMRAVLAIGLLATLLSIPVVAQDSDGGPQWWNERVFYQIFVRSFYDSDGDGTGDIQGIIEKLDYLNDGNPATGDDLAVTGLWLMPIQPSPSDHGYDATDYTDINPDYGTLDDMRELVAEAHARGIAVIIDLVINHTSVEHPWFVASAAGDPQYANYYIWADENPGFRGPDTQNVWHAKDGRFYYALFSPSQPDLNFANPDVTAEMIDIARFWLEDVGVDGFRVDAVKFIVEEGRALENTSSTHAWLEAFHAAIREIKPDAVLVGEVWDATPLVVPYVGGEMDIAFEFDLAAGLVRSASFGLPGTLLRALDPVLRMYPPLQYATFIANHDQDRFMSQANGSIEAARRSAYALLTLPGVPFIYYGEEIGMSGRRTLPDTDNERRSPMQWDDSANGGFTTGEPWFRVNPEYPDVNVAAQQDDPASVLNAYRTLTQLRAQSPALQYGDVILFESADNRVLAFARHAPEQTLIVLINMDDQPTSDYALSGSLPNVAFVEAVSLLDGEIVAAPELGGYGTITGYQPVAELPANSIMIVELVP